MLKRQLINGGILALSALISPCAISSSDEINRALDLEPDIEKGKQIYALCATCHGKELEGGLGPSFLDGESQASHSLRLN